MIMKPHIVARIYAEANYIVTTHCSVRECAPIFNVSKSTVWRDCALQLPELDLELYYVLHGIFKVNKSCRKSGKVGK